jgi:hypothetical protein
MQSEPTIKSVPDVPTLAKNYLNAEKLIGAKRLAIPSASSTAAQWGEVWQALGRPESHDKYSAATVKPVDGLNIDNAALDEARKTFHTLGLNDSQAKGILDFYIGGLNKNHTTLVSQMDADRATATEALRKDWGDKYDANMEISKNALRHFGGEDVFKELEAGLGNHTGLIRMLHKIGGTLLEDRARGGSAGGSFNVSGQTGAIQEIETLKQDSEFMKAMNDKTHAGHNGAVARWMDLHRKAYPGVVAGT